MSTGGASTQCFQLGLHRHGTPPVPLNDCGQHSKTLNRTRSSHRRGVVMAAKPFPQFWKEEFTETKESAESKKGGSAAACGRTP
jgi:hypothetical protein